MPDRGRDLPPVHATSGAGGAGARAAAAGRLEAAVRKLGRGRLAVSGHRRAALSGGEAPERSWFRKHGVLAQELLPSPGYDLRLLVGGGKLVGAAKRISAPGEWRTNVAVGGRLEPLDPPAAAVDLALRAAPAAAVDLVGVDVLPVRDGFVVLELNGRPTSPPRTRWPEGMCTQTSRPSLSLREADRPARTGPASESRLVHDMVLDVKTAARPIHAVADEFGLSAGRVRDLRPRGGEDRADCSRPAPRPSRRTPRLCHRGHSDQGRRRQDDHVDLARGRARNDRRARGPVPPGAVPRPRFRHQGRRHRWRPGPGDPDGVHQSPFHRRHPRDRGREQSARGDARGASAPRQPSSGSTR